MQVYNIIMCFLLLLLLLNCGRSVEGVVHFFGWHVHGNDVANAAGRAEYQRHNTDDDQHHVSDYHPRSHGLRKSGELDDDRGDDAEQRETEGADEPDERSDGRYGDRDQHCRT